MSEILRVTAITLTLTAGLLGSPGAAAATIVNDITQLNPIKVEQVVSPKSTAEVSQLVSKHSGPVSIGGGRYSQGGQIATENCLFLDMRQMDRVLSLDVEHRQITVEAGITWRKIQEAIDSRNLSIKIMQSYSNFTVGGSLSVNVHGRYVGEGPLVRSVEAIKLVLADGTIHEASRSLNPELFFGAIGGYGGIGVITEATLNLAENSRVERYSERMGVTEYKAYFLDKIRDSKTAIFHNADLYPPNYKQVNAVTWSLTNEPVTVPERLAPRENLTAIEQFFLAWFSSGPLGKQIRQYIHDPYIYAGKRIEWRNYEASYDVASLEPPSREKSTYVLQEYFVPIGRFDEFVPKMAAIFEQNDVNVLNVSIRHALPDPGTLLAWAREEVFAFVVYYEQGVTEEDRKKVRLWTSKLIEAATNSGGTYYLPYQIIATPEQFLRGYPRSTEYFSLKERVDPSGKFRNKLWDQYYNPSSRIPEKKRPDIKHEKRPEEQTFYTIPEWYIVYSAEEFAEFLKSNPPSRFPYFSSISQFWRVRDGALRRVEGKYPSNTDYQTMIWVIGLSFSMENALKGIYESTIGRIIETISSVPEKSPPTTSEERFMQKIAEEYARFIRDLPWYEFPFRKKLVELWDIEHTHGEPWVRSRERKLYGLLELSAKTLYSGLIKSATASAYEPEDFFLVAKVSEFSPQKITNLGELRVELVRDAGPEQQIIAIPRYESFSKAAPSLMEQGVRFHEISGNRTIALTVLAPRIWKPDSIETDVFMEWDILTEPDLKRVAIAMPVEHLHRSLPHLGTQKVRLDHIYDY